MIHALLPTFSVVEVGHFSHPKLANFIAGVSLHGYFKTQ